MRFSIITVCYNEEKRIHGTLESIYRQSFRDFEHIIEDGDSKDNTLSIVKSNQSHYDKGQLKIYSESDSGLYDAMNKALSRAEGEYICFINSGDYLFDENTLENVNREIEESGHKDIYHGISITIFPNMDGKGQNFCELESVNGCDMEKIVRTGHTGLIHQAIYANRKCFVDNKFDLHYKLRAELRWYYMCFHNGYSIHKMNFPVCKYTYGGLSEKLTSIKISQEETREILKEFHYSTEWYEATYIVNQNYCVKNNIIYNQWLALLHAGHSIKEYLDKYQMKTIAIYGYAEYTNHLINELRGTDIKILYLVDRREIYPYAGIPVIRPEDELNEVDVIIVTALTPYEGIKKFLKEKVSCPIISLEEIFDELWFIEKDVGGFYEYY